ncbi:MAG TPA: HAMP domain-containing sensor histidine kinase [Phycisphaerales bacterium]|nr:HAMP domain-containing sensor histidine kinase [Phycisphaerales bacterium]
MICEWMSAILLFALDAFALPFQTVGSDGAWSVVLACAAMVGLCATASSIPNVPGLNSHQVDVPDEPTLRITSDEQPKEVALPVELLARLPAVIWTVDNALTVTSLHGAGFQDVSADKSECVGYSVSRLIRKCFAKSAEYARQMHRRALQGESVRFECRRWGRSLGISLEPMCDHAGRVKGCIGLCTDSTAIQRAAVSHDDREQLEKALHAMERVLGVIGHELRSPLAGLQVLSEHLLAEQSNQITDSHRQFIRLIHDEVIRLSGMVNNMLEAARLNSGTAKWNWSEVDVFIVCTHAIELMRPLLDGTLVHIVNNVPRGLKMQGDGDALLRLLLNLLSNSQKHTSHGEIVLGAAEMVDHEERWVELEVRDTGSGIRGDIAGRLGVPFALNAGVIGAGGVKGVGLGLAICKGIAAAHGGSISLSSAQESGTNVKVRVRADLSKPCTDRDGGNLFHEVAG